MFIYISRLVDTNADCSVLVFDSYYMAQFRTAQVAAFVLYQSYRLRNTWLRLLNQRIGRGLGRVSGLNAVFLKYPNTNMKHWSSSE